MESKKLSCKTALLCEKSSVDPKTKLISLINIVESVFVTSTPDEYAQLSEKPKSIQLPLELVVIWERVGEKEEEIHDLFKVRFCDPQGKVIFEDMTAEVHMPAHTRTFYSSIKFSRLLCSQQGIHTFEVVQTDVTSGESTSVCKQNFEIIMVDAQRKRFAS